MSKTCEKVRCAWVKGSDLLKKYHDEEWGVAVHDDQKHFEMLLLEGAQAGLNWITILKKRENYRRLFKEFDPVKVAQMSNEDLDACLKDKSIIRNRLKVYSARKNAIAFLNIQKEFGSFDNYIWQFVAGKPFINNIASRSDLPTQTLESNEISKDLKKRGMTFVGPTIIYAYMEAIGLVNDHTVNCWRFGI
jgi:DNA-3-methyladenine glycosylase I